MLDLDGVGSSTSHDYAVTVQDGKVRSEDLALDTQNEYADDGK